MFPVLHLKGGIFRWGKIQGGNFQRGQFLAGGKFGGGKLQWGKFRRGNHHGICQQSVQPFGHFPARKTQKQSQGTSNLNNNI
jgi:hypothetical protein